MSEVMGYRPLFKLVLCLACISVLCLESCSNDGELAEKKAWSALQSVEFNHRGDLSKNAPLIVNNVADSGLNVLGMQSGDKKSPFVWIILNEPPNINHVKLMPQNVRFYISCDTVNELFVHNSANVNVKSYLLEKCERP